MIVDELKKAILQYAIQGKLTKKFDNDSSILDLVSNPKNELPEKEINFSIPDNWLWVQLNEIAKVYGGKRIPVGRKLVDIDTGHRYIRVADMKNGTVLLDDIKYITNDIYSTIKNYFINSSDLYITVAGTIGDVGVIPEELDGANLTENANKIVFDKVNKKWLYYCLKSPLLKKQISNCTTKVGQPKLAIKRINNFFLPLPPLEEQQRIVDRIEELFNLLDELKDTEIELNTLKSKFPEEMRKAILLCAINGNMNVNNPKESIEVSIKSSIDDSAKPFEIPNNWKWYSHNDLFEVIGGSQPPKGSFATRPKEGYVQLYQIRDYGENPQPVYIKISDAKKNTNKDDILLARYGGSLGKVFWAEEGAYNVAMARVDIKYPEVINKKYLYYYYCADLYQKKIKSGNRSAQAGFSKEDLNDLCFPLPPIEEQQRIVEKLDYILPLIESL